MESVLFWVGRSIGDRDRYKIDKHLHSTRMSSVYKAFDHETGRAVVIKIADSRFQSHGCVQYLKAEDQTLRSLNHPHIVRLLDSGILDEGHFLVLEHVRGRDLDLCISKLGPLSLERSVQIVVQVLEVLEYMHEKNELHGDVKASNVMLSPDGIKMIDFGLSGCRPLGAGFGTDGCAAPEQRQGLGMDCRSDLYSVGVILYEALTDESPFFGFDYEEKEEKFEDYWNHKRPFAEDLNIPIEVQEIVWKALEVDPGLRYQNAWEMRRVLLDALRFILEPNLEYILSIEVSAVEPDSDE